MDKSVPRVTVWHHSTEPRDAKQGPSGQTCLSYPQTHDNAFDRVPVRNLDEKLKCLNTVRKHVTARRHFRF